MPIFIGHVYAFVYWLLLLRGQRRVLPRIVRISSKCAFRALCRSSYTVGSGSTKSPQAMVGGYKWYDAVPWWVMFLHSKLFFVYFLNCFMVLVLFCLSGWFHELVNKSRPRWCKVSGYTNWNELTFLCWRFERRIWLFLDVIGSHRRPIWHSGQSNRQRQSFQVFSTKYCFWLV